MARGDHIFVALEGYTHHGIDAGDGTAIHWTAGGAAKGLLDKSWAEVRQTPLADFARGRELWVREYQSCFDADTVVARARTQLGRTGYDLADDNCEHFACWCKTGCHQSEQVKGTATAIAGLAAIGTAIVLAIGVVAAAGTVVGLSAAGTLAGLTAVGQWLGGGAATGLFVLATLPVVAALLTILAMLPDDVAAAAGEREARSSGRTAGLGGAVAGMATVIGAVASLGSPGLSAGGIASGLIAIGAGQSGLGLFVVLALPATAALGAAVLVYRLAGGGRRALYETEPATISGKPDEGLAASRNIA